MTSHEPIEATEKLFTRTRSRSFRGWIRFGVYFLIIGVFALLLGTHKLDRLEALVRDSFLKQVTWGQAHPGIVLIEIPETALAEIGPWPWPRSYHAIMARLLSEWKAAAVVLDLDLSEPTDPKNDQDLAQSLGKVEIPFYLPVELKPQQEKKFWVHGMPVVLESGEGKRSWIHPLPEFEKEARGVGHSYLASDPDGLLRRFDPFITEGKESHLFLPLRVAFDQMKKPIPSPQEWERLEDFQGKILIPWSEAWDRGFTRYNYADLIHSFYAIQKGMRPVIDPGMVAGKICLVGPVAPGATDLKVTPLSSAYARIGVYAQVLNAALTSNWVRPVSFLGNILCLLGCGVLAMTLFVALSGAWSLVAGLLLVVGWFAFCFTVFAKWHLGFYVVTPALLMFCLFIFTAIYAQATAMREKSHLFHLATRDGLTELYVIRHFRLIMNQIVREASSRKQPLSVILLDIDNFKKINDTYGHPAGDMVLKKTAAIILAFIRKRRPFREIDFAARYGGEEFIIMLRKAGLQEAAEVAAERIRKKIEETKFEWEGKAIRVTVSLGVAVRHAGENVPDPMVHRADAALYKAKEAGKNRVWSEGR
ncbi:MAG: diguanylate cyclase [Candidatus Omnitrophota bacterium]